MKRLLYYLPSILTLVVVFTLDEGWMKWLLLILLVLSVLITKYKRSKLMVDEVEFDERVNTNIRYWSFGFLVITNALLMVYLILVSQSLLIDWITVDFLMIYLSVSLLIALYIVPSIAKRF